MGRTKRQLTAVQKRHLGYDRKARLRGLADSVEDSEQTLELLLDDAQALVVDEFLFADSTVHPMTGVAFSPRRTWPPSPFAWRSVNQWRFS